MPSLYNAEANVVSRSIPGGQPDLAVLPTRCYWLWKHKRCRSEELEDSSSMISDRSCLGQEMWAREFFHKGQ